MEPLMIVMKAAWLITALGSIHVGAMALDMDYCMPYHNKMKPVNLIIGVAGIVSLVGFVMMLMK